MKDFTFEPAPWVPYRNKEVLERCRKIGRADIERHRNPDFRIRVVDDPSLLWVGDMILRIQQSDEQDRKLVMILPNPAPAIYTAVAELVNRFRIDCRNVHMFNMDEWADQDGNVAPESWRASFNHSFIGSFYGRIDPDLRMPRANCRAPTTETLGSYSDMITECGEGGADICYSGPGWTGHLAFIDPDTPEFACGSLEEFLAMGSRIVILHPMTIMQNSLHGMFGCSGDVAAVPPRAATIGPADVKRARNRMEFHALTTMGSVSSWQRMTSRLVLHGEVTPKVPSSILQLFPTSVYVSEMIAKEFGCWETVGY